MVDKDIHCLSWVYDATVDLKNCVAEATLTDAERASILYDVGKRTNMLLSPVHVVARLLDPRLRDITVFSNAQLMAQFDSVVDRLVGKKGSREFDDCKDQLEELEHVVPCVDEDEELVEAQSYREACVLALEPLTEEQGEDAPTVRGGWLDLERDWVDENLEGEAIGMLDATDHDAVTHQVSRSERGSTNIVAARRASEKRTQRQDVIDEVDEEGDEEEEEEEDEEEEDGGDEFPREEWNDDRSDSDRSWTRREDITPYHQEEEQQEEQLQEEEQQQEEQPDDEQDEEEREEEQHSRQAEQQQKEEEQQQQQQQEEEEEQQEDAQQEEQQQEEEQHEEQHEEQQEEERQREDQQDQQGPRQEPRAFYGPRRRPQLLGRLGANVGGMWDPLSYRPPRGGRGGRRCAPSTRGRPRGRPPSSSSRGSRRPSSKSSEGRGRPRSAP
ncbi:hypothetical protein CBR_g12107 [Chara braunii]|uniref:Uncharacterized protein n=1 Tax=Chara braunii TaxID=69332 RepID=A0A388KR69_CHABU|nr:hypothetical protein CBR_g12107 [Chara braunii]|eukprot:GBG72536.1 hypothetical protein CBR_g12107 [Chara braunii]